MKGSCIICEKLVVMVESDAHGQLRARTLRTPKTMGN